MTDLFFYHEEEPKWLKDYFKGETFTFKELTSSRVGYYSGSEFDGTHMKVGNKSHAVHSFLYVNHIYKRNVIIIIT